MKNLFWFNQDLRLSDNPGLCEAAQNSQLMVIYILDERGTSEFSKMGTCSRWWLHHSLCKLNESLEGKLNVYQGDTQEIILKLLTTYHFDGIYWNRCYEPERIKKEAALEKALKKEGIAYKSFNASLLWEPTEVLKSDGTPYKIFTPFYRNGCLKGQVPRKPIPGPKQFALIKDTRNSLKIADLALLSVIKGDSLLASQWKMGEEAARKKLSEFLENGLPGYQEGRNFPAKLHVSRLSPHLHFGEISPRQIWKAVQEKRTYESIPEKDVECFLSEIAWREFSYYLLYHFPDFPQENFQKKFNHFPWQTNSKYLAAWQQGQTGYPFVDAGLRELAQTGYMHNRLRMVVGSFLIKNLLLDWRQGEAWFWEHLVDADLANNSVSWQWVAGSGADPAPYFRIFNPITQGEKYDPDGVYTRKFVPELSHLPSRYLFKPWKAPEPVLKAAGVTLGKTYPQPIVDLNNSRQKALLAFSKLKAIDDCIR